MAARDLQEVRAFAMPLFDNTQRLSRLDLVGRRVFLRADLDVPLSPFGAVLDDARLCALLPTLRVLREAGCRIILAGHYPTSGVLAESVAPRLLAKRLSELFGCKVMPLDRDFRAQISLLGKGELGLAPDLSRYPGETENDPAWRRTSRAPSTST
jgi:phosphoglycerate kinase